MHKFKYGNMTIKHCFFTICSHCRTSIGFQFFSLIFILLCYEYSAPPEQLSVLF